MCKEVIIIGAGGHAKVICDIIRKSGDKAVGFLDDSVSEGTVIMGIPVLGKSDKIVEYKNKEFIIGIGNNTVRKMFSEKYPDIHFYTAVHPCAIIAEGVTIRKGSCVMAGAVINADAKIGKHCIINTSAVVEHDCFVDDFSHISPGTILCGTVKCGKCVHIGAGAVVKNNIDITGNVTIGAGAAVVKNITEDGTYVGVPAKKIFGDV